MFDFIPIIRNERRKEINNYKKLGVKFIEENHYMLIRRIYIPRNDDIFTFEVRANFKEPKFYIIKNDSCIYLSFYEIYLLLNDICLNSDIDIIKELEKICNDNSKANFIYENIEYLFPETSYIEEQYYVNIPNSSLIISYNELLILISLIQEKSNYLWSRSDEDENYNNGLINLLITLLNSRENNELLNKIGWNYSTNKYKYSKNSLVYLDESNENYDIRKKIVDRKYYLTDEEMKSILTT